MAIAKRDMAKRTLYSQFLRGPVLGSESEQVEVLEDVATSLSAEELRITPATEYVSKKGKDKTPSAWESEAATATEMKTEEQKGAEIYSSVDDLDRLEKKKRKRRPGEAEKAERKRTRKEEKRLARSAEQKNVGEGTMDDRRSRIASENDLAALDTGRPRGKKKKGKQDGDVAELEKRKEGKRSGETSGATAASVVSGIVGRHGKSRKKGEIAIIS